MSNHQKNFIAPELKSFTHLLFRESRLYSEIHFPPRYNNMLNAFCNAAQHGVGLRNFYRLCAAVPAALDHNMQGAFFLYDCRKKKLAKVCDTKEGIIDPPEPVDRSMPPSREPYESADMLIFPLFSRPPEHNERLEMPWEPEQDAADTPEFYTGSADPFNTRLNILGMFSVRPLDRLFHEDRQFFKTLSRWIGYEFNRRLLVSQNLRHLRFVNALGRDIGHNIIIPNMRFGYLFRHLEKKIAAIKRIETDIASCMTAAGKLDNCRQAVADCADVRCELEACHHELRQQHLQISLFLESLFREEHFRYGHLVLRTGKCFVEQDIILPQLKFYASRFAANKILIEKPRNMYEQEFPLMLDVGLLSQVYANLFSNAIKYAREIIDHTGSRRKAMAYGCEEVMDFPSAGLKGVKFNVFTTGPPLLREECKDIFTEGIRGHNTRDIEGTGHGLAFILRVVEAHGGEVGVEATEEGNNFFFILPLSTVDI